MLFAALRLLAAPLLQDFRQKMERGGGLGVNYRDMPYWKKVQKL